MKATLNTTSVTKFGEFSPENYTERIEAKLTWDRLPGGGHSQSKITACAFQKQKIDPIMRV
jgi:hypothetical protein